MNYNTLELKVEKYVRGLFKMSMEDSLYYHNLEHTETVVQRVKLAANEQGLISEDCSVIVIAAWFHDTGYLYQYTCHEEKSIQLCTKFLQNEGLSETEVATIRGVINATNLEVKPNTELEALLKDVDIAYALYLDSVFFPSNLYLIGNSNSPATDFITKGKLLKKEREAKLDIKISHQEWSISQLHFLDKIKFYTTYGKMYYTELLERTKREAIV